MTDRLLIAGDTHGDCSHVITLLDNAKNHGCSRVFVVGDFGAWEHMADGREFFDDVNRHAAKRQIPVYFLDGNHDKSSLVEKLYAHHQTWDGFYVCREWLYYAPRGLRWQWGATTFIALGGARSIDPDKNWRLAQEMHDRETYDRDTSGTLWFPEEEMTDADMDAILSADPSPVDVMLTHDKPRASHPSWNRKDLPECWPNQDRIQRAVRTLKPGRLYHGHLHWYYHDEIRCGDGPDDWTQVYGLNSNPRAAEGSTKEKRISWVVMHLDYTAIR